MRGLTSEGARATEGAGAIAKAAEIRSTFGTGNTLLSRLTQAKDYNMTISHQHRESRDKTELSCATYIQERVFQNSQVHSA